MLTMSQHARQRFGARFPLLNMAAEISAAKPMSKARRNKLMSANQIAAARHNRRQFMVTPSGAILLVCEGLVVTVISVKACRENMAARSKGQPRVYYSRGKLETSA